MDKDSTTFGLKPDKLAQLWNMGGKMEKGKNEGGLERTRAELLRDRLAKKMPLDHVMEQILPKTLSQICKDIQPFTGNSYGALLNDPAVDITVLTRIKNKNKELAQHVSSEAEYDVTKVIYYAAIAGALIHHDRLITSFSYGHLRDKYASFLENTWLTPDILTLFQKALDFCGQKMKSEKDDTP